MDEKSMLETLREKCVPNNIPNHKPPGANPSLFLKGPIPLSLVARAGGLPGKALQVFLAIWLECDLKKSQFVKITHRRLESLNVLPDSGRRALLKLESAGLIHIDRHRGRSPLVTLLPYPTNQKTI